MKFKPYDLVEVPSDEYQCSYVGEVMSFETPERTYMVRTVPGHPGTLVEVAADKLKKVTSKFKVVHYAVVEGSGAFPVDMLRRDRCVPVNFSITEDTPCYEAKPEFNESRLIVAQVGCSMHDDRWTFDRWESFSWKVTPLLSEAIAS